MRLIDADALIQHLQKDPLFELVEQYGLTSVIEAQPAVVRCKDCVFWKYYCRVVDGVESDHVCSKKRELDGLMHRTNADDFCSWAERKEE